MEKEYALYKGDQLLSIGTLEELQDETGLKRRTLLFYGTPSYKNRTTEQKGKRLVFLGDE